MRRLTPSLVALVVGAAMNLFPAATGAMTKDTLNALISFSLFILCEKWRIRLMNVSKKKKGKSLNSTVVVIVAKGEREEKVD